MSSFVFLGGTCNDSTWRERLIQMLRVPYFNPVVPDWTEEAYQRELRERETCQFCLYVLTPKMTGVYSIAEAVDDSNKRPGKTIFCYLPEDDGVEFSQAQVKSMEAVKKMIRKNGGHVCEALPDVAAFLNQSFRNGTG